MSHRSYKEAMSFDAAAEIIRQESGTHFDPDLVQAFNEAADSLQKVVR